VTEGTRIISSYTDSCADNQKVLEYSCVGGAADSIALQCSRGTTCINGYCKDNEVVETHTIQLAKGWNLFSIPVENPRITTTCSRFGVQRKPWHYDAGRGNWTRVSSLREGKGYWFKADENCTITATGTVLDVFGYELKKGWNQIGASVEKRLFDAVLASCDMVHGPWGYETAAHAYTNADKTELGNGYFVKVADDCRLS
jgi:hypothetical protein